jgi:hypothetical protein
MSEFKDIKNRSVSILESHLNYINKILDNKQKFYVSEYTKVIRDFEVIKKLNIDSKVNAYCDYILDELRKTSFHKKYQKDIRAQKLIKLIYEH